MASNINRSTVQVQPRQDISQPTAFVVKPLPTPQENASVMQDSHAAAHRNTRTEKTVLAVPDLENGAPDLENAPL